MVLTVSQVSGAAKTFTVVASPSSITAGGTVNYTVTALDANNLVAIGYAGTVTFTSSDAKAVLAPNPYMFTTGPGGDNGIHTFTTATLGFAGNQTITATDGLITGTSNAVTVTPGSFAQYVVGLPGGTAAVAGNAFIFTVQRPPTASAMRSAATVVPEASRSLRVRPIPRVPFRRPCPSTAAAWALLWIP